MQDSVPVDPSATVPTDSMPLWRTIKPRSLWGDTARAFARNKAGMLGLTIAVLLVVAAVFAPLIAPYDPVKSDFLALRQGPSLRHIMGTDELGRDVFSRILFGARTAILVAVITTTLSTVTGVIVGAFGAYLGGWIDSGVVWLMDALLNFPGIWLAAFISVSTRPTVARFTTWLYHTTGWTAMQDPVLLDYLIVFGCLALVSWPGLGRLVRGQVLSLREKE